MVFVEMSKKDLKSGPVELRKLEEFLNRNKHIFYPEEDPFGKMIGLYSWTTALEENDVIRLKVMPFSDACVLRTFFANLENAEPEEKELWEPINETAKNNFDAFVSEMEKEFGVSFEEVDPLTPF